MAILNKILTDVQVRILLHGKLGTKKYGASRDLTCAISRLYSGNFGIFDYTQSIMNIDGSVCRAWKMLSNDTKISMIPWDPDIKNAF